MPESSEPRFRILGEIRNVEVIARRRGIRVYRKLCREFGFGNWRKLKGIATVELEDGRIRTVESGLRPMASANGA